MSDIGVLANLLGDNYVVLDKKLVCGVPETWLPDWLIRRIKGNPVNNLGPYVRYRCSRQPAGRQLRGARQEARLRRARDVAAGLAHSAHQGQSRKQSRPLCPISVFSPTCWATITWCSTRSSSAACPRRGCRIGSFGASRAIP